MVSQKRVEFGNILLVMILTKVHANVLNAFSSHLITLSNDYYDTQCQM